MSLKRRRFGASRPQPRDFFFPAGQGDDLWPRSIKSGSSSRPITPVDPAKNILNVPPNVALLNRIRRQNGSDAPRSPTI
jgi:hypothetical protein